jgi:hypothetical protein
MLALILSTIGSFLGGPFIKAALQAYQDKLASENTIVDIKGQLAQKELELQARELEVNTQYRIATAGAWYLPDHLMGYAVALYFGKLLVWDKVLALGATDPLGGWAAFTANLIVSYYFAKVGIENVLKIWRAK